MSELAEILKNTPINLDLPFPHKEGIKVFTYTLRLPQKLTLLALEIMPFTVSCSMEFEYIRQRGNMELWRQVEEGVYQMAASGVRNYFERMGFTPQTRAHIAENMIEEYGWSDPHE